MAADFGSEEEDGPNELREMCCLEVQRFGVATRDTRLADWLYEYIFLVLMDFALYSFLTIEYTFLKVWMGINMILVDIFD